MEKIQFRLAEESDLELIVKARLMLLEEDSGAMTETESASLYEKNKSFILAAINSKTYFAYLAFAGEEFAGTCSACLYSVLPGRKLPSCGNAYLQNMFVFPQYRRRGLGKKLVSLVIAHARDMGYERITLHATKKGRLLFEKCGFVEEQASLSHMIYCD